MKSSLITMKGNTMYAYQPIVLVDMDGVIADFNSHLVHYAHEKLGAPLLRPEQLDKFHSEECYKEEFRKAVSELSDDEGFFKALQPIEGALEALKEMEACGLRVFICTAPKKYHHNPYCPSEKHGWIMRYLGGKWTDRIVLSRDKTLVHGDVLIDDKPEVVGVVEPSWVHVYYDQPYNRKNTERPRIPSWSKWKEVIFPILEARAV